jgi:hypothetical protein
LNADEGGAGTLSSRRHP